MKINRTHDADSANKGDRQTPPKHHLVVRLTASSARLAADAAGSAVAGSAVGLAFFLSRKPTASFEHHHAKFRA
jgi:hypothetical protein